MGYDIKNIDKAENTFRPIKTDMTLEEFFNNDIEGYEYVKGELRPMPPPTMEHGEVSMSLILPLGTYVRDNKLGHLYPADTTFKLGDRIVKPDIAYVSTERLPENRRQVSPIAPDLAVEVVSPTDALYDVNEKALAYIEAGTRLVWVIEPVAKTVKVFRSERDIRLLTRDDTLSGEDVIEGFSYPVDKLFE